MVCILTISAGCFGSRGADNSNNDGGHTASDATRSDDDGGHMASVAIETALLGTWTGSEVRESSGSIWTFTFSESEVTASTSGIEAYRGRYQMNTDVVPHQADFYIDSSSISSLMGKVSLGIFRIDDNVMTLAAAAPGHPVRPGVFEPSSDGTVRVWELEKQ